MSRKSDRVHRAIAVQVAAQRFVDESHLTTSSDAEGEFEASVIAAAREMTAPRVVGGWLELPAPENEPPLGTPEWVRERATRGIQALVDGDVDIVREVLDTLASYDGR